MNKLKTTCYSVCLAASFILVGCTSNKDMHSPSLSRNSRQKPKFIDDISLSGGGANTVKTTTNSSVINGKISLDPALCNILQVKYAKMLQVIPQSITNINLYNFIDEWYGVRYRMGGNDKDGIDCSAFVQRLYESVFCTNLTRTAFEQFSTCRLVIDMEELKEGDLVFFSTHGKKRITHVGIYLMNDFFVHASSSRGVAISSLHEQYWSRSYAGAGHIPKSRG